MEPTLFVSIFVVVVTLVSVYYAFMCCLKASVN